MPQGKIFILSGPSGSGKTTLYRKVLAKNPRIAKSISMTTRPKRAGEREKKDYFFVSKKMFLYKKRAGHFLESEKVFDNYYGTPKKHVFDLLRQGKHVLLCIDVKGAKTVRRHFSQAVSIFIKTKNLADLKKRLSKRASEDQQIIQKRLDRAKNELKESSRYDYVVINDNLNTAFSELQHIINKEVKE